MSYREVITIKRRGCEFISHHVSSSQTKFLSTLLISFSYNDNVAQ